MVLIGEIAMRRFSSVIIFAFFILAYAFPVRADSFEDGIAAVKRGDVADAVRILPPLAWQGHFSAHGIIGEIYLEGGEGVRQDYAEAAKWHTLAANNGWHMSQYSLALMYQKGEGVPKDYDEAFKWYVLSAKQGNSSAQQNIAALYYNGNGVNQDTVLAYVWARIAIVNGSTAAKKMLQFIASKMSDRQIDMANKILLRFQQRGKLGL